MNPIIEDAKEYKAYANNRCPDGEVTTETIFLIIKKAKTDTIREILRLLDRFGMPEDAIQERSAYYLDIIYDLLEKIENTSYE